MKTTFRRTLTMILCLLLAATLMIGVSFWVFFRRYVTSSEESSLRSTADTVAMLARAYDGEYLGDMDFRTNLSVAAAASECDILICDTIGTVRICANDIQACEHLGRSIGSTTASRILRSESTAVSAAASGLYCEERLAVAVPVTAEGGVPLCIVVVSIQRETLSALTVKPLQIFIMVALLVLGVSLLATPYLTRRETKPVRDMAAAAKQIAHGNYQVRIPTGYQNEEMRNWQWPSTI